MALVLSLQDNPDDEDIRSQILEFCSGGPEYRKVWEDACRVFSLSGTALGAKPKPRKIKRKASVNRRDVLKTFAVVGGGVVLLKGATSWRRWMSDAATDVAEIRHIALPDRSSLILGPDSAVNISFTSEARRIKLVEGMVFCDIVEEERPFEAKTEFVSTTSQSGRFELRNDGRRSLVAVEEGLLRLALLTDPSSRFELNNGDWLSLGLEANVDRGRLENGLTASWRRNILIADNDEISEIVGEISRWRHGITLIPEKSLARATVSGRFDLKDPEKALAAVIYPYGGKVRHLSPWVTILTTI